MSYSDFELVRTSTGALSIRNKIVNEIMHNPIGPWAEANALYVEQSQLKKRIIDFSLKNASMPFQNDHEFVLYDVGLGAAANALAAWACVNAIKDESFQFRLVSFEKDLSLLKFALDHVDKFAHFQGYEKIINELLSNGEWKSGSRIWQLYHGDFLDLIQVVPSSPQIIFYDPYSPEVNSDMWTSSCFEKLFGKCRTDDEGSTLYTYSQATPVRTALIMAGFYVGYGQSTGLKHATTEATSILSRLRSPLGEEWLSRWQKSSAKYPYGCNISQYKEVETKIRDYFLQSN